MTSRITCIAGLLLAFACSEDIELGGAGQGGEVSACSATSAQCNNCVDDDRDGLTDGFDPECTSADDDLEGSFATGIPGDNRDAVNQDCFFDGDSGAGNDGCDQHVCCFLDTCPEGLPGPPFDAETDCPELSQECVDFCAPLTPPGCDCFGCCTVCSDGQCADIFLNPAVAPDCDQDSLGDSDACPRCTKSSACGSMDCSGGECTLCPGESLDDLPDTCSTQECGGGTTCTTSSECGSNQYCSVGCCIDKVL